MDIVLHSRFVPTNGKGSKGTCLVVTIPELRRVLPLYCLKIAPDASSSHEKHGVNSHVPGLIGNPHAGFVVGSPVAQSNAHSIHDAGNAGPGRGGTPPC